MTTRNRNWLIVAALVVMAVVVLTVLSIGTHTTQPKNPVTTTIP